MKKIGGFFGQLRMKSPKSVLRSSLPLIPLSFAAGLASAGTIRIFYHFGGLSWWIGPDLLLESFFALALFAFCRSYVTVIATQFLLGTLFRWITCEKIVHLDTPFLPSDFFLFGDFVAITPGLKLMGYFSVLGFVLFVCVFLMARQIRRPRGSEWLAVAPAAVVIAWIFIFPKSYAETFDSLVRNDEIGIPFLIKQRVQAVGVPLSFTVDLAKFLRVRWASPDRADVAGSLSRIKAADPSGGPAVFPLNERPHRNVYILLSESFWDPDSLLQLSTKSLAPDFRALWTQNGLRHFLSPTFGGGTANVEFELLCGIPSRSISRGIIFQVAFANRVACLPSILAGLGYHTFAFHPFAPGFYNRSTIFPRLGFEHFYSIEDFLPGSSAGTFLADQPFLDASIAAAKRMSDGKPFLAYLMTYAGHWPFAWLPTYEQRQIVLPGKAEKPDLEIVERHLNVNLLASETLARAIFQIRHEDPTALVVVAGDHLPGLVDDLVLNLPSDDITDPAYFSTPLLVLDPEDAHDVKPAPPRVPAYRLATEILSRLGLPEAMQAHLPWFAPPKDLLIRPLQNGALLVFAGLAPPVVCTPQSKQDVCQNAVTWFNDVHNVAADLVTGAQYSLDGR